MTTLDQQAMVDAFRQVLDEAMLKMVSTMQRPSIVASESGASSLKLGVLASGKIQWELKLYAEPSVDPYEFVTNATYIAEQLYSFYDKHKPGEPLLVLQRAAER